MEQMPESDRPLNSRVEDLETRMGLLEQAGQEPTSSTGQAVVEVRLGHVEQGIRDLKEDINRRFGEVDKRIESSTNRLTFILSLYTGVITLAVMLSQLLFP